MCYFLYLASPLTLSEVRAMLPPGLAADLAPGADQRLLRRWHPTTQTGLTLLVGACSCALSGRLDDDPREGERALRARYFELGVPRDLVIRALERHRKSLGIRPPPGGWPAALAGFVGEHARNAGPALYYLRFDPRGPAPIPAEPPSSNRVATVSEVRTHGSPAAWLPEAVPTTVVR